MSRRKKPAAQKTPPRPWCQICKGTRMVDGPSITRTYENRAPLTFSQLVPCECMKRPWPPKAADAPPAMDAQRRASGEGEA